MRSTTATALLVALALLVRSAALAQEPATATPTDKPAATAEMQGSATGKVVSMDDETGTLTIQTSTGTATYRTDANSRFTSDGRSVELASIHVGDRVTLHFEGNPESPVVTHVEVFSAGAQTQTAENSLPGTASPLPLVGLVGILLVGAGIALRVALRWVH